jgi:tuftelin-interacting protein 11
MAREGKGISDQRSYIDHEETRIRQVVESQERAIERLQGIMKVVASIKQREIELVEVMNAAVGEVSPGDALSSFTDDFDELLGTYGEEYEDMKLDEVVVAAISPLVGTSTDDSAKLTQTYTNLSNFDSCVDCSRLGILFPIPLTL